MYRKTVVGQFAPQKPGFFGKAGLLLPKRTHYANCSDGLYTAQKAVNVLCIAFREFGRMHAKVFSDLQLHAVDLGEKPRH